MLVPVIEEGGSRIVADHFGSATSYIVISISGNSCRKVDELRPARRAGGKALLVASWAMNKGVKAAVAKEICRRAYDYLRIHGITLYYIESSDPCEAARAVAEGEARVYPEELVHEDKHEGGHGHGFEGNLLR